MSQNSKSENDNRVDKGTKNQKKKSVDAPDNSAPKEKNPEKDLGTSNNGDGAKAVIENNAGKSDELGDTGNNDEKKEEELGGGKEEDFEKLFDDAGVQESKEEVRYKRDKEKEARLNNKVGEYIKAVRGKLVGDGEVDSEYASYLYLTGYAKREWREILGAMSIFSTRLVKDMMHKTESMREQGNYIAPGYAHMWLKEVELINNCVDWDKLSSSSVKGGKYGKKDGLPKYLRDKGVT